MNDRVMDLRALAIDSGPKIDYVYPRDNATANLHPTQHVILF